MVYFLLNMNLCKYFLGIFLILIIKIIYIKNTPFPVPRYTPKTEHKSYFFASHLHLI